MILEFLLGASVPERSGNMAVIVGAQQGSHHAGEIKYHRFREERAVHRGPYTRHLPIALETQTAQRRESTKLFARSPALFPFPCASVVSDESCVLTALTLSPLHAGPLAVWPGPSWKTPSFQMPVAVGSWDGTCAPPSPALPPPLPCLPLAAEGTSPHLLRASG